MERTSPNRSKHQTFTEIRNALPKRRGLFDSDAHLRVQADPDGTDLLVKAGAKFSKTNKETITQERAKALDVVKNSLLSEYGSNNLKLIERVLARFGKDDANAKTGTEEKRLKISDLHHLGDKIDKNAGLTLARLSRLDSRAVVEIADDARGACAELLAANKEMSPKEIEGLFQAQLTQSIARAAAKALADPSVAEMLVDPESCKKAIKRNFAIFLSDEILKDKRIAHLAPAIALQCAAAAYQEHLVDHNDTLSFEKAISLTARCLLKSEDANAFNDSASQQFEQLRRDIAALKNPSSASLKTGAQRKSNLALSLLYDLIKASGPALDPCGKDEEAEFHRIVSETDGQVVKAFEAESSPNEVSSALQANDVSSASEANDVSSALKANDVSIALYAKQRPIFQFIENRLAAALAQDREPKPKPKLKLLSSQRLNEPLVNTSTGNYRRARLKHVGEVDAFRVVDWSSPLDRVSPDEFLTGGLLSERGGMPPLPSRPLIEKSLAEETASAFDLTRSTSRARIGTTRLQGREEAEKRGGAPRSLQRASSEKRVQRIRTPGASGASNSERLYKANRNPILNVLEDHTNKTAISNALNDREKLKAMQTKIRK